MLDCLRLTPIGLDVVDIGIRRITELGLEVWCLSKAEWFGCWRRRATERGRGTGEGQSDSRFPPGAMTNQSRRGGGFFRARGRSCACGAKVLPRMSAAGGKLNLRATARMSKVVSRGGCVSTEAERQERKGLGCLLKRRLSQGRRLRGPNHRGDPPGNYWER